MLNLTF